MRLRLRVDKLFDKPGGRRYILAGFNVRWWSADFPIDRQTGNSGAVASLAARFARRATNSGTAPPL
jgi:hypothetical protein